MNNSNQYLEEYYNEYDEESRLEVKHGQVEYITTMHYIHQYLAYRTGEEYINANIDSSINIDSNSNINSNDNVLNNVADNHSKRILEVGAGTGRYSIALAREGYQVDAVELVEHNLNILKSKITEQDSIRAIQGNALDLSAFADNTFDLTLVLGPMYHLYTNEDKKAALKEAIRVTKEGGYIMVAYCMNDSVILQYEFGQKMLLDHMKKGMISDDFHCISKPVDLFAMVRTEEIKELTKGLLVQRMKLVATDGASQYMCDSIDSMDEALFQLYLKYHLSICEREDLIGATNHSLDILKKQT